MYRLGSQGGLVEDSCESDKKMESQEVTRPWSARKGGFVFTGMKKAVLGQVLYGGWRSIWYKLRLGYQ